MEVVIWTQDDCPKCVEAKTFYTGKGLNPEIRQIEPLMTGLEPDMGAMVALAMQNNVLPLVRVDCTFVKPGEYK